MRDRQESFRGDFQGKTREVLKKLPETDADQEMTEYLGLKWHERVAREERVDYRNGFYERDYVTPLGVLRLRIPRTRQRSFLPRWIGRLERRAPEAAELIRQAILRGEVSVSASSYLNFAYSSLACLKMGMSESASFHSARNSRYIARPLAVSPPIV